MAEWFKAFALKVYLLINIMGSNPIASYKIKIYKLLVY